MLVFSSIAGNPAHILFLTVSAFAFLLLILNAPFCFVLPPTCHMDVLYDTQIQHVQGLFDSKVYKRKFSQINSSDHRTGGRVDPSTVVEDLQVIHFLQNVG
jgi:hypothetical protein